MYSISKPYGHINKTSEPTCKPYGYICKTYGITYRPYGHTWTHSNQTNYALNMDMPQLCILVYQILININNIK